MSPELEVVDVNWRASRGIVSRYVGSLFEEIGSGDGSFRDYGHDVEGLVNALSSSGLFTDFPRLIGLTVPEPKRMTPEDDDPVYEIVMPTGVFIKQIATKVNEYSESQKHGAVKEVERLRELGDRVRGRNIKLTLEAYDTNSPYVISSIENSI